MAVDATRRFIRGHLARAALETGLEESRARRQRAQEASERAEAATARQRHDDLWEIGNDLQWQINAGVEEKSDWFVAYNQSAERAGFPGIETAPDAIFPAITEATRQIAIRTKGLPPMSAEAQQANSERELRALRLAFPGTHVDEYFLKKDYASQLQAFGLEGDMAAPAEAPPTGKPTEAPTQVPEAAEGGAVTGAAPPIAPDVRPPEQDFGSTSEMFHGVLAGNYAKAAVLTPAQQQAWVTTQVAELGQYMQRFDADPARVDAWAQDIAEQSPVPIPWERVKLMASQGPDPFVRVMQSVESTIAQTPNITELPGNEGRSEGDIFINKVTALHRDAEGEPIPMTPAQMQAMTTRAQQLDSAARAERGLEISEFGAETARRRERRLAEEGDEPPETKVPSSSEMRQSRKVEKQTADLFVINTSGKDQAMRLPIGTDPETGLPAFIEVAGTVVPSGKSPWDVYSEFQKDVVRNSIRDVRAVILRTPGASVSEMDPLLGVPIEATDQLPPFVARDAQGRAIVTQAEWDRMRERFSEEELAEYVVQ